MRSRAKRRSKAQSCWCRDNRKNQNQACGYMGIETGGGLVHVESIAMPMALNRWMKESR